MTNLKYAMLLVAVLAVMAMGVSHADDAVPLNCSGNDCGAVPLQLPGSEGMPSAGEAQPVGTAPGEPILAPEQPNIDPIAPNEPPPPDTSGE